MTTASVAGSAGTVYDVAQLRQEVEAGRYDAAIAAAQDVAARGAFEPEVLALGAFALIRSERAAEADALYGAMENLPDDAWKAVGTAGRHRLAGEYDEGRAAAAAGLLANPQLAALHFELGYNASMAGDWPAAAKAFGQAAELEPESAYNHFYAGVAHDRAGRLSQASTYFHHFMRLAPEAPEKTMVNTLLRRLSGR